MVDIFKKLQNYEIISFDIFDTLIRRTVNRPVRVFDLVEKEYLSIYGEETITDFGKKRIEAERRARSLKKTEITLDDIYSAFEAESGKSVIERYKRIEEKVEIKVCAKNETVFKIYQECLKQNKRVIIISDMYLPQDIIKEILKKNDYEEYSDLYVSSELGHTKVKGSLFDYVLNSEGIVGSQLLHIGDNPSSDIRNARVRGIDTYQIKYAADKNCKYGLLNAENRDSVLQGFFNNSTVQEEDIFKQIGYKCFGPLLYGFIEWIVEKCKEHNHAKIYFLSRDGFLMKKVFNHIKGDYKIQDYYMYASRRALQVAAIHFAPDYERVMENMFIPRSVTVDWLLERWGLDRENCEDEVMRAGIEFKDEIDGRCIKDNGKIKKLYELLQDKIINNSKQEYESFISYLKKIQFEGNAAIVDIGWYGNMQNSLMTIIENSTIDVNVTGYYLGIVPKSAYQDLYKMNGYLFQKNKNEEFFYKFKYLNSLMELFFMAPHGSAQKYDSSDRERGVILSQFEYGGTYTEQMIRRVQEYALKFIDEYKTTVADYMRNDSLMYADNLYSTLMRPNIVIAERVGELAIWDKRWIKIAEKRNIAYGIFFPKKVLYEFMNTPWKVGYMKMMFRVPLKYDDLVYRIRKRSNF